MKKNIGTTDRILRLVLAILILWGAYHERSWIFLLLGLFVFYEAIASWCIVYALLGKNSCPLDSPDDNHHNPPT